VYVCLWLQVRQKRVESEKTTKNFGSRVTVGAPAHKLAQLRRKLARRARKALETAVNSVKDARGAGAWRAARAR
jgi:hypothetical protein